MLKLCDDDVGESELVLWKRVGGGDGKDTFLK
jgi:hypothetical protein